MSKFLHRRKKGPPADDVEAHPSSSQNSGDTIPPAIQNIGEYPALDRYISIYRDDTGPKDQEDTQKQRSSPKWWQFWKSPGENAQATLARAAGVPEGWLTTEIYSGLSQSAVDDRRRVVGWNELTTEKENVFAKIITYFQGPILYGKPVL